MDHDGGAVAFGQLFDGKGVQGDVERGGAAVGDVEAGHVAVVVAVGAAVAHQVTRRRGERAVGGVGLAQPDVVDVEAVETGLQALEIGDDLDALAGRAEGDGSDLGAVGVAHGHGEAIIPAGGPGRVGAGLGRRFRGGARFRRVVAAGGQQHEDESEQDGHSAHKAPP